MTITLFGATGAVGKIILADALAAGHAVRAVVRDPRKLGVTHANLDVATAELTDDTALARAVRGADAIISGLGLVGRDLDAVTKGVARIVAAMERENVSRLVAISGAGVVLEGDRRTLFGKMLLRGAYAFHKRAVLQKQAEAEVIVKSRLDWTLPRPTQLLDVKPRRRWRTSLASAPSMFISRADIAAFMLEAASDPKWSRTAPFVTW